MKVTKHDGALERQVLAALVTDDAVLRHVAARYQPPGCFRSRFADVVASWCVDYFAKHHEAPRTHVRALYAAWAPSADEASQQLVESFLSSLDYDEAVNADFVIDQVDKLFDDVLLERTLDEADGLRRQGQLDAAWARLREVRQAPAGRKRGVDVLTDHEAIERALSRRQEEPLIKFPGALGEFFDVQDCLHRDCLVQFAGPKGRGKSMVLIDLAWRAMEQRRRTTFFALGDMSESQMMARFVTRAARRPIGARSLRWPASIRRVQGKPELTYETIEYPDPLTYQEACRAFEDTLTRRVKSTESYLKLYSYPAKSASVAEIESVLRADAGDGFAADCVVVDYADLLAPPTRYQDERAAINANWTELRALAQKFHCLMVTATQTNRASYYADVIGRDNFADDRRKIDHCHAAIGINQTADEKEQGVLRYNFFALREDDYDERRCVYLATCLAAANVCVRSCW